jgi:hypothetical protein
LEIQVFVGELEVMRFFSTNSHWEMELGEISLSIHPVEWSGTKVASQKRRERPGGQVYNHGGRDSMVV